jgi:hypothetical protein
MTDEKKSFAELLNDAPLAAGENTVRLVGSLARSNDNKKFVLGLAGNQSVTIEIDAVKDYRVLSSGIAGPLIVEVEVDRHRLPAPTPPPAYFKDPIVDLPRMTAGETTAELTLVEQTGALYGPIIPTNPGDPWGVYGPSLGDPGVAPFAIAAARQAPQHVIGAMAAAPRLYAIPKYAGEGTGQGVVKAHEHTVGGTGYKDTTFGPEDW